MKFPKASASLGVPKPRWRSPIRIVFFLLFGVLSGWSQVSELPTCAAPVLTVIPGGSERKSVPSGQVTAACATPGAIIRYTLGGTVDPGESDPVWPTGAGGEASYLTLDKGQQTVRARAWAPGYSPSASVTRIISAYGAVAARSGQSFVIDYSGKLWAWGEGLNGRLGYASGGGADQPTPVRVKFQNTLSTTFDDATAVATAVEHSANNTYYAHSLFISKANNGLDTYQNTVWAVGYNGQGQLGNGGTTNATLPVRVVTTSSPSSPPLTDAVAIAAGRLVSAALTKPEPGMVGGYVWTWGYNGTNGKLGNGSAVATGRDYAGKVLKAANIPLDNIVQISAGREHMLALDANGSVWAWGDNALGQLGGPSPGYSRYAVQVNPPKDANGNALPAYTNGTGGLGNIAFISCGEDYNLAVTRDGKVLGWGETRQGRIGDGNVTSYNNAGMNLAFSQAIGVSKVQAGSYLSIVQYTDGSCAAMGLDLRTSSLLGNGSPVPITIPPGKIVADFALGVHHAVFICTDGTILTWGEQSSGELGNGNATVAYSNPTAPTGAPNLANPALNSLLEISVINGVAPGGAQLKVYIYDAPSSVARVEYYANGSLIGTQTAPVSGQPWQYAYSWTGVLPGTYDCYARIIRTSQRVDRTLGQRFTVVPAVQAVENQWFGLGYPDFPDWQSFVMPLDFKGGSVVQPLGGGAASDPWYLRILRPLNAHVSGWSGSAPVMGQIFQNVTAAFGGAGAGSPLEVGRSYSFGVHSGYLHHLPSTIVPYQLIAIQLYPRTALENGEVHVAPVTTHVFNMPRQDDLPQWRLFAQDGFKKTFTTFDSANGETGMPVLETTVQFVEGLQTKDQWGTTYSTPLLITHKALTDAYYVKVGHLGYLESPTTAGTFLPMAVDHLSTATPKPGTPNLNYALEFEQRPAWRSSMVTVPHFNGKPLPSHYFGKTVEELAALAPVVQWQFADDPAKCLSLDDSPELCSHPELRRLCQRMGIPANLPAGQPVSEEIAMGLVNYVLNEIELTDALAVNDSGASSGGSVNAGGISRGAMGVLLERQGSPTEQCALLIYLLRKGNIPAAYVFPPENSVTMLDGQLSKLLRTQLKGALDSNGHTTNAIHEIPVNYPWVTAYIGGKWRHIFPWIKDTEIQEGSGLFESFPAGYRSGADWVRKYLFRDPAILDLDTRFDSVDVLFPKFLEEQLKTQAAGVSPDKVGVEMFNRRHNRTTWSELPRPWSVRENGGALKLVARLSEIPDIFDTLEVDFFPQTANGSIPASPPSLQSGAMPLVSLHNRRMTVSLSTTGNATLQIDPYFCSNYPDISGIVPGTGTFSTVNYMPQSAYFTPSLRHIKTDYIGGLNSQVLVRTTYRRHRKIAADILGPKLGLEIQTLSPELRWSPVVGATGYRLKVKRGATVLIDETISGYVPPHDRTEREIPPGVLAPGESYNWSVYSLVGGSLTFSETFEFKTSPNAQNAGPAWDNYLGVTEKRTITQVRPLGWGDTAALCLNYGRVTREMLNVHLEEYQRHQQYVANGGGADGSVFTGGMTYLLGQTYYERLSRFGSWLSQKTKTHVGSFIGHGYAKLSPARNANGAPLSADYVNPNIDMSFEEATYLRNGSLHQDSPITINDAQRDFFALHVAAASSLEHATLDSFFPQLNGKAMSTVRLLHEYQKQTGSVPGSGTGLVFYDRNFYQTQGLTSFTDPSTGISKARKDWLGAIWTQIDAGFTAPDGFNQSVYATPGPVTVGQFKGVAALISKPYGGSALIGGMNGGFATQRFPSGTMSNYPTIRVDTYESPDGEITSTSVTFYTQSTPTTPPVTAPRKMTYATASEIVNAVSLYGAPSVTQRYNSFSSNFTTPPVSPTLNNLIKNERRYGDTGPTSYMGDHEGGWTRPSEAVADPVSTVTGEFNIDAVDFRLPGPMPLEVRRTYSSSNLADNDFGAGWRLGYFPYLTISLGTNEQPDYLVIRAVEMDGSVIAYRRVGSTDVWRPTTADNPQLANQQGVSAGTISNRLNNRLESNVAHQTFTLFGVNGEKRTFTVKSFGVNLNNPAKAFSWSRPYLTKWEDDCGNYYNFFYQETDSSGTGYGNLDRVESSNGNALGFIYDVYGHIIEIYTGDGRRMRYDYNGDGDLVKVTFPDASEVRYEYRVESGMVNGKMETYSTHLIEREIKPDGRILKNVYDGSSTGSRRVVEQQASVGENDYVVTNATFKYFDSVGRQHTDPLFNAVDSTGATTGKTEVRDAFGRLTTYEYDKGQLIKTTDALLNTTEQQWYQPGDVSLGAYPRSLKQVKDVRGLITTYTYDARGNVKTETRQGDLTGNGLVESITATSVYDDANPDEFLRNRLKEAIGAGGGKTVLIYGDPLYPFQATTIETYSSTGVLIGRIVNTYAASGPNKGMLMQVVKASGTVDATTVTYTYDTHGFVSTETHAGPPSLSTIYRYNLRGEKVEETDAAGNTTSFAYDALGRQIWMERWDAGNKLVSWKYDYYNRNGELEWSDGPRYNPEDYIYFGYDGGGRMTEELHWRSQAKADGTGVEAPEKTEDLLGSKFSRYDAFGNLAKILDARGNLTTLAYDELGRLLERRVHQGGNVVDPIISQESFTYEPGGKVLTHTGRTGGIEVITYNSLGQITTEQLRLADGSIATEKSMRYLLDGRLDRETRSNGNYTQYVYDDGARKVTQNYYTAAGVLLASESMIRDYRGNITQTTDAEGAIWTSVYDKHDRNTEARGPVATGNNVQEVVQTVYDDVAMTTKVLNGAAGALGYAETRIDALGRAVEVRVFPPAGGAIRTTTISYSADQHMVATTVGSGSEGVLTKAWSDNEGHPVLTRHSDGEYTLNVYNVAGDLVSSRDSAGAIMTFGGYDAQGRLGWKKHAAGDISTGTEPGATERFVYDPAGFWAEHWLTDYVYTRTTYDSVNRPVTKGLFSTRGGVASSRSRSYTYYPATSPWRGLLQSVTMPQRGIVATATYDDWLRLATKTTQYLPSGSTDTTAEGPLSDFKNQATSYTYDKIGRVKSLLQSYASSTTGPSTSVVRTYNSAGRLDTEETSLGGAMMGKWTYERDQIGRRTGMVGATVGSQNYQVNFGYDPDGKMKSTSFGLYTYDSGGRMVTRVSPMANEAVTGRDSRGRVTGLSSVATNNSSKTLLETAAWGTASRLSSYTRAASSNPTQQWNYHYNLAGRLTREVETTAGTPKGEWRYRFDTESLADNSPKGLGIGNLTSASRFENTAPADWQPASWHVWDATLDFGISNPYATGTSGMSGLTGPLIDSFDRATFGAPFITANTAEYTEKRFDGEGQIYYRTVKGGQKQRLYWDGMGQLVRVEQRDKATGLAGFDWAAIYDGLGRRVRTTKQAVTAGMPSGPITTIDSIYDPDVEFLEVGLVVNGVRYWKRYGPDISGTYGGSQGVGGLICYENSVRWDVHNDLFGNIALEDNWTSYKPHPGSYGVTAGSTPPILGDVGVTIATASVWQGRRMDPTGLYWMGARYFDPESRQFISPDPVAYAASLTLYDYAHGDPVNFLDADGRLAKRQSFTENYFENAAISAKYRQGPGADFRKASEMPQYQMQSLLSEIDRAEAGGERLTAQQRSDLISYANARFRGEAKAIAKALQPARDYYTSDEYVWSQVRAGAWEGTKIVGEFVLWEGLTAGVGGFYKLAKTAATARRTMTVLEEAATVNRGFTSLNEARQIARMGPKPQLPAAMEGRKMGYVAEGDGVQPFSLSEAPAMPVQVDRRLSPAEMRLLTEKHGGIEFALFYKTGPRKNGGGGTYWLTSGIENKVVVPQGADIRLIYHTHPKGSIYASPSDRVWLEGNALLGSPQKASRIVPIGSDDVAIFDAVIGTR